MDLLLNNKPKKHKIRCQCGKKVIIYTMDNSGKGNCECGAKIVIN